MNIKYTEEGEPVNKDYYKRLIVSCYDFQILNEFVKEAISYKKQSDKKILVYINYEDCWFNMIDINAQPMNNIFLKDEIKQKVINHINYFIKEDTKQRYIDFGRSYKTGILLSGVPGSGKTSIIKSIAKDYGRDIYILNFSKKLTDETFIKLMSDIPEDSIVLFEDIDSFFNHRDSVDINVSFSNLINVIDGALSLGNGTIFFITANSPEKLDPALLRPGRMDLIVKFDFPTKNEVKMAFDTMINCEEQPNNSFDKFYDKVCGNKIRMSAYVDYFFRYTDTYMDHIDELLEMAKFITDLNAPKIDSMYM